jgi:hypothetical protein
MLISPREEIIEKFIKSQTKSYQGLNSFLALPTGIFHGLTLQESVSKGPWSEFPTDQGLKPRTQPNNEPLEEN